MNQGHKAGEQEGTQEPSAPTSQPGMKAEPGRGV